MGGGGGLMRGHHYGMLRAIEWHTEFLLHTCCLTITVVEGGGGGGGGGCASFAYITSCTCMGHYFTPWMLSKLSVKQKSRGETAPLTPLLPLFPRTPM